MSSLTQQDKISLESEILKSINVFEKEPETSLIEKQRQESLFAKREGYTYDPQQGVYIRKGKFSVSTFRPGKPDETIQKDLHPFHLTFIPDVARSKHPYFTATLETTFELATDIVPFTKYLRSKDRRFFMTLNKQEQVRALLFESLAAALWGSGERILKDVGYALKVGARAGLSTYDLVAGTSKLARASKRPLLPLKPVEDLVEWKKFFPEKEFKKALKTFGIKDPKNVVQRVQKSKGVIEDLSKPQGLYTTPIIYRSPHIEADDLVQLWKVNPAIKILEVDTSGFVQTNRGLAGISSGIGALRRLVGGKEFERLTNLSKPKLTKELQRDYPKVAWSRYIDQHEMLEGLAGIRARMRGFDAIRGIDKKAPAFSEFVGLTKKSMTLQGKPFKAKRFSESLSIKELEKNFAKRQFLSTIKSPELLGKVKGKRRVFRFQEAPEAAFKTAARSFYAPEQVAEMSLKTATTQELTNFTQFLLGTPGQVALRKSISLPFWSTIRPIRAIYGAGQNVFGARDKIYLKTLLANEKSNLYASNKIELYKAMLTQRGLMSVKTVEKGGKKTLKFKRNFTEAEMEVANKILVESDEIMSLAVKEGTPKATQAAREAINKLVLEANPNARNIVNATRDYFDTLYGEEAAWAIRNVLGKELSEEGIKFFSLTLKETDSRIQQLFSTASSLPYDQKVLRLNNILNKIKERTNLNTNLGDPLKLFKPGSDLVKVQENIAQGLTFQSNKGSFVDYLENYVARTSFKEAELIGELAGTVSSERKAFYTRSRIKTIGERKPLSLEETIAIRTRSQAKRMFLFDELKEVVNFSRRLPASWRGFTEHYLSRMLGLPSQMDTGVAKALETVVGPMERTISSAFGRTATGLWDEARVLRLAQSINNVTYLGFLGFKPFTGLRNLFQPLLTVPTDLGGIKDIGTLARGYKALWTNKSMVKELNQMGILGEALPELTTGTQLFNFGRTLKFKGKTVELPTAQRIRDVGLWFVTSSDKLNRYVSGASAMIKWDETLAKEGAKGLSNLLKGRHEHIRVGLSKLVKRGDLMDARKGYVRDVVADTQFLYGVLDSPIMSQSAGIAGKTGVVFQSWWMNFGELLVKWLTTGTVDTKTRRLFAAMASNAMAYTALTNVWDRNVAISTTFLGPLPQGLQLPPAWQPISAMIEVAFSMADIAATAAVGDLTDKETRQLKRSLKDFGNTSFSFAPGGLFLKGLARGAERGGAEGFGKALIGVKTKPK